MRQKITPLISKKLCVKQLTLTYMVLGETGRFPSSIAIKTRMLYFWCKLITSEVNRFSPTLYNLLQISNFYNILRQNGFNTLQLC